MSHYDDLGRSNLPIPDPTSIGLTTYDAKDPDTEFPPIEPLRPPAASPNVLMGWGQIHLGDDAADADHLISPDERYRIAMARQ